MFQALVYRYAVHPGRKFCPRLKLPNGLEYFRKHLLGYIFRVLVVLQNTQRRIKYLIAILLHQRAARRRILLLKLLYKLLFAQTVVAGI